MRTLTDFKRELSAGKTVTLIHASGKHKWLGVPRKVEKVQTNGVMFEGGSWLYYSAAKDWAFEGNHATWVDPDSACDCEGHGYTLVYEVL
jgi:hypothetical protein